MSAADLAKGIEFLQPAVIAQLLTTFFPNVWVPAAFGSIVGVELVVGDDGLAAKIKCASRGAVTIELNTAGAKKVFARVLTLDLSTLLGMSADEASLLITAASDDHEPDAIELLELGGRWVRDNENQLAPYIGAASKRRLETAAKVSGIEYVDGESLDDIARLAWELSSEGKWLDLASPAREAKRGEALDVIHALRAVGYTIVAPPAGEMPPATVPAPRVTP